MSKLTPQNEQKYSDAIRFYTSNERTEAMKKANVMPAPGSGVRVITDDFVEAMTRSLYSLFGKRDRNPNV